MTTTPVTIKLEDKTKKRLKKLGELRQRSAHWLMKTAIELYLAQAEYEEKLKQETLHRWKEVEAGKIVNHEAVMEWLNTWGISNEKERPPCEE